MKNKTILWSKIIIFIEYLFLFILIITLANFENLGAVIVFIPWLFVVSIIISIIGILLSIKMKLENLDEKIDDLGPLGPKPQIFYSSQKQLLFYSILFLLFSTAGLVLIINQFHFSLF